MLVDTENLMMRCEEVRPPWPWTRKGPLNVENNK